VGHQVIAVINFSYLTSYKSAQPVYVEHSESQKVTVVENYLMN